MTTIFVSLAAACVIFTITRGMTSAGLAAFLLFIGLYLCWPEWMALRHALKSRKETSV